MTWPSKQQLDDDVPKDGDKTQLRIAADHGSSTYSRAEVVGWDLSMIQPVRIPPNLTFRQRNFESPWHGEALESWDLIYMRMLAGSVSDWNDLYSKAWRFVT